MTNSAPETQDTRSTAGTFAVGLLVAIAAAWWIFRGLEREPHFADESAMIAQSYYYTLLRSGRWDHPDWLHYAAYDHPPLPKYMFGASLAAARLPVPQNLDRWMAWIGFERVAGRWVARAGGGDFSPPAEAGVLYWSRVPAAVFGVGGVLATFALGVLVRGRWLGLLAALLVAVDPLYLTHTRRAMSDSFAECLVIASVVCAVAGMRLLWSPQFRRWRWLAFVAGAAASCGLAAEAKLNGGVATVIVLATLGVGWLALAIERGRGPAKPTGASRWNLVVPLPVMVLVGAGSFAVFVALNPFLTARPEMRDTDSEQARKLARLGVLDRTRFLVQFRREWSQDAMKSPAFERDWLSTPADRIRMTVWEGFGRYSPLGPRNIRTVEPRPTSERFGEYRRAATLIWFPLFLWGVLWAIGDGWRAVRNGGPPAAWCLVVYAALVLAVVVLLIPLNWDRYYLPLQPCTAVLVPYGVLATLKWISSRLVLKPDVQFAS
jgi:hypothetical protein